MTEFYVVHFDDGKEKSSWRCEVPKRLPQAGDVYEWVRPAKTLGGEYKVGDRMEIIERTQDAPYNRLSTLGNLRIRTPYKTSVWAEFDGAVARNELKLISSLPEEPPVPRFDRLFEDLGD